MNHINTIHTIHTIYTIYTIHILHTIHTIHTLPTIQVLTAEGEITKGVKRFPGENKVGMLAWLITLKTPQYPSGRDVVFIANDVTVQSGSFGVKEDDFFYKASEYARLRKIPRIFISCNSGARIGLVDELKPK